jgi:hypothetical protein
VKPDTHIKAIFFGIGISKSKDDYIIYNDVIEFFNTINKIPYEVDKLFWLVGNGQFYREEPAIKIKTNHNLFINRVKNKFGNSIS